MNQLRLGGSHLALRLAPGAGLFLALCTLVPLARAHAAEAPAAPGATPAVAAGGTYPVPSLAGQVRPERRDRKSRLERLVDRLELGVRPRFSRALRGRTRASFGDGGLSVKPTYFKLRLPRQRAVVKPDLSFSQQSSGDNKLTTVSVGMNYRRNLRWAPEPLPGEEPQVTGSGYYPYYEASLDLVAGKVKVPADNLDEGWKLGLASTLNIGLQYKTRWNAQASVSLMTKLSGYDFSRVRVGVNYKL